MSGYAPISREARRLDTIATIRACRRDGKTTWRARRQQKAAARNRWKFNKRADYSVVVKNRAPPPKAWRWEIYRAGNVNPIKQSSVYFDITAAARRAGKEALKDLLNKLFA